MAVAFPPQSQTTGATAHRHGPCPETPLIGNAGVFTYAGRPTSSWAIRHRLWWRAYRGL